MTKVTPLPKLTPSEKDATPPTKGAPKFVPKEREQRYGMKWATKRMASSRQVAETCEGCKKRDATLHVQGHGALYLSLCSECYYGGDENPDPYRDHGWCISCPSCNGHGDLGDGLSPCPDCDGEGTVDG